MGQHEDRTFMINFSIVLALLALLGIIIYVIAQYAGDVNSEQQAALAYEKAQERTQPVSQLCVEGDDCGANAESAGGSEEQAAAPPADIYSTACFACHGTGAAGAPKLGDAAAWAPRAAQGLDTVVANAINGINGMPARGGADLTDDQIKAVVEYMLKESGQ